MRFKCGDVVIKATGGNKMTIYDCLNQGIYKCVWFVESTLSESLFREEDILTIEDYKKLEERHSKITQLGI